MAGNTRGTEIAVRHAGTVIRASDTSAFTAEAVVRLAVAAIAAVFGEPLTHDAVWQLAREYGDGADGQPTGEADGR